MAGLVVGDEAGRDEAAGPGAGETIFVSFQVTAVVACSGWCLCKWREEAAFCDSLSVPLAALGPGLCLAASSWMINATEVERNAEKMECFRVFETSLTPGPTKGMAFLATAPLGPDSVTC